MLYNMTEKLALNEDPMLQVKEHVLTVNSDAEAVLKLMEALSSKGEIEAALEIEKLLFSEADREKIRKLKLKINDYITLIQTATQLALGEDPDEEPQAEGE